MHTAAFFYTRRTGVQRCPVFPGSHGSLCPPCLPRSSGPSCSSFRLASNALEECVARADGWAVAAGGAGAVAPLSAATGCLSLNWHAPMHRMPPQCGQALRGCGKNRSRRMAKKRFMCMRHHTLSIHAAGRRNCCINGLTAGIKKPQSTRGCGIYADFHAPLWEAPNGPPGGHFRAEEASPENHEPSQDGKTRP